MRAYKFLDAHFGLKSLSERRLKISTLEDLNDPFELLPFELSNPTNRAAARLTLAQAATMFGLICFSADWHDPVIWAHYSDKHKGLCLGFDVTDEVCGIVRYVSKRLSFPSAPELADARAMLFTKFDSWKYEREIRAWLALNERENGIFYASFGEDLTLSRVIAGARCTLSEREIVNAIGKASSRVDLVKARAGFKQFEIVKDKRGFLKRSTR